MGGVRAAGRSGASTCGARVSSSMRLCSGPLEERVMGAIEAAEAGARWRQDFVPRGAVPPGIWTIVFAS